MYINLNNLTDALRNFKSSKPFNHCIVENFFKTEVAKKLENEFPDFNSNIWHIYDNKLEDKKVCNDWNSFPEMTYKVFSYLNSTNFIDILDKKSLQDKLYADPGLHGGGWHIHSKGGKLNVHLDYSLHPKMDLQRKLNIIIYLNSRWKTNWGGSLGLYDNKSDQHPGQLISAIEPRFNRAVIFDTSQNSWHGLPQKICCPENEYRKSLAIYYLCKPQQGISDRGKALFSPSEEQRKDESVYELIRKRSSIRSASSVYVEDSK